MKSLLSCFIIFLMMASQFFPVNIYYVDATNGNDLNDGLSEATAWKTLAKVNNSSFSPGDSILLKRGETWRERLIPPSSGRPGNPITFGAYGRGDKPTLLGSVTRNNTSNWINESGNLWYSDGTVSHDVGNMIMDSANSIGVKCQYKSDLDTQGEFWYDPTDDRVYLYSTNNPATYYNGDIEIATMHPTALFDVNNKDFIIVQNLHFKYSGYHGMETRGGADYITVEHCDFSYLGGTYDPSDVPTRMGNGIEVCADSTNITVRYSRFWEIWDAAITTSAWKASTKRNERYYYNLIWNCRYSFEFLNWDTSASVDGVYFENNTCYNAGGGWGRSQRSEGSGTHLSFFTNTGSVNHIYILNNIFYESSRNCLYLHPTWNNLDRLILDHNCYYQASGTMIKYQNQSYTMAQFSTYQADEGKDANSITSNPLLTDPSNNDFTLQATSPCIDAGRDVDLAEDHFGNTVPYGWAVDIGAYESKESIKPLNAIISASLTSGEVPLAVSFTGSVKGGTSPYSYSWNFGDGSSSSEQNPSHTYSKAGTYSVTLTATDSKSSQSSGSLTISASSNPIINDIEGNLD